MDIWVRVAQVVLSLSILIVLHEFGHFIPARLFKTKVEKFYLFFDWKFSLFKKKIGETEWGIGWIPLGGYVKISGMVDESMDTDQLAQPAQPWEFRSKPAWQRLIIMLGGIIVNVIVGFTIFILVTWFWGEEKYDYSKMTNGIAVHPVLQHYGFEPGDKILTINGEKAQEFPGSLGAQIMIFGVQDFKVKHTSGQIENIHLPENIGDVLWEKGAYADAISIRSFMGKVKEVVPDSRAEKAGFKKGDKIIAINKKSFTFYDEFVGTLYASRNKSVDITVSRNGKEVELKAQPDEVGKLGFVIDQKPSTDTSAHFHQNYGFFESFGEGISMGSRQIYGNVAQFKYVFTSKGATQIGGVGTMSKLFPTSWDWQRFWLTTAFLSMMLAVMNLLPIPALDGGHVVFLIYEIIARKPAPQKVLEIAQYIGFFLLIGLMLYANGNDLIRWITGK